MDSIVRHAPPRRAGMIVHITAAVLLAGATGFSLWFAFQQAVGAYFVLLLILSLLLLPLLAIMVYRGYALQQAGYSLERDGLRLRWGLRAEDIPLPDVEWVRSANELGFDLPLPALHLPGAILGTLNVEGLGAVEFMASDAGSILLVATSSKVFAISPENPGAFMRSVQRTMEMGSIAPIASRTALPAAYLQVVWADRRARALILSGLGISLLLFVIVGVLISTRPEISLGYTSDVTPMPPTSSERLLLLPVLAGFAFGVDLTGGLFFYRRIEQRLVAYLLWASSSMTGLLLILAVLFII